MIAVGVFQMCLAPEPSFVVGQFFEHDALFQQVLDLLVQIFTFKIDQNALAKSQFDGLVQRKSRVAVGTFEAGIAVRHRFYDQVQTQFFVKMDADFEV